MRAGILMGIAMLGGGCGSASYGSSDGGFRSAADAAFGAPRCFGANDCPPGQACNEFGFCTAIRPHGNADLGTPPLPPEVVVRPEPPASGKLYVYVAVPSQDTVAKIDSTSLQVRTIQVGHDPGPLRTVPGADVAVVLNRGSSSATVLRSRGDGGDDVLTLPTAPGLNQLAISPSGGYGIAWFDLRASGGELAPQLTFQDATLLVLDANGDRAIDLSVGFRPSGVQFSGDGQTAFLMTEQGISVIRPATIQGPAIVPTVPVLRDATEMQPAQIAVTGDGKLALAHLPGVQGIRVVDLGSGALGDVPLGGEPSDIELSPDGTMAVIALRDAGQVALASLPGDLADPTKIRVLPTGGYAAGQAVITPDGAHAFLFTNAVTQKALLVADLKNRLLTTYPLQKGVRTVLASADGRAAVILHNHAPGTPSPDQPLAQYIDEHEAYSLFDVGSGYVKLQLVGAAPGDVAFAPDGSSAYLLQSDVAAGIRVVDAIDLRSFIVHGIGLGSPPLAVGVVPATGKVYVAQEHPLGRMTFVDTRSFHTRTLTGYGLDAQIIE